MDKTQRAQKIASYGKVYQTLIEAIREFPVEMWQYRPTPDAWTIHETIVHITDSEANSFIRARRAIAEPGTTVLGYNEPIWAKALNYHQQSTDDALELFKWLRGNTYKLIKDQPDHAWSHTIEHSENGTMTLEDWLITYEDHIPAHIAQMREVHEMWLKERV
jgi:uncharacterized damage-inducible protein DinB